MRKFQRCRALQSAHECLDQWTIRILDLPDVGTLQILGGNLAGHCVELLVQIHHQDMEAVSTIAITLGQVSQRLTGKSFVILQRMKSLKPQLTSRHQSRGAFPATVAKRASHDGQVSGQGVQ